MIGAYYCAGHLVRIGGKDGTIERIHPDKVDITMMGDLYKPEVLGEKTVALTEFGKNARVIDVRGVPYIFREEQNDGDRE